MPRGCSQRHQPLRKTSQKVTRRQNKAQTAGWNRNSRRRELWLAKFVSQNWRPVFVQKITLPEGDYIIKAREKTGKSLQKWKVGYKICRSLSKCETRLQNGNLGWLLNLIFVYMVIFCKNWSLSAMNIVILNYFFIMTILRFILQIMWFLKDFQLFDNVVCVIRFISCNQRFTINIEEIFYF